MPSTIQFRNRIASNSVRTLVASLLLAAASSAVAAVKSWNVNGGTNNWNTTGNWVGGTPTSADDVWITNATVSTGISNRNGTVTIANLVISNSTAGAKTTLILSNTNFRVDGTSVVGNNGVIQIGSPHAQATANTTIFSNGNLYVNDGGGIVFAGGGGSLTPDTLIVAGAFTNTTSSFITNVNGGSMLIKLGTTVNASVTNNGTISAMMSVTGSGAQMFTMTVGTSSNNFLVNNGTMIFGTFLANSAKLFVISNQFVNTGMLVMSNAANGGAGGQVDLRFTGTTRATGGASTNTGTIRMVQSDSTAAASAAAGTLTLLNGDFVNAGTITFNSVKDNSTRFILSEAGAVFSNAATGRIVGEFGSLGTINFAVNNFVNAGTLVASGAVISVSTPASGFALTNMMNSGTILFGGGNVAARVISNSGTLVGNGSVTAGTVINDGRIQSSGGLLWMQGITNNSLMVVGGGTTMRTRDLSNAGTGIISNTAAATLQVAGSFVNEATGLTSNSFNLTLTDVQFFSTGAVSIATLQLAGTDFGATFGGLTNNYAFGGLTVTNNASQTLTLTLAGSAGTALYVSNLTIAAGNTLDLAGKTVYFYGSTNLFGTLTLSGGSVIALGAPVDNNIFFNQTGPGSFDYDTVANWTASPSRVATNPSDLVRIDSGGGVVVTQNTAAVAFSVASMLVSNNSRLVIGRNQTWTGGGTIGDAGTIEFTPGNTVTASLTIKSNGVAIGAGTITGQVNNQAFGTVIASNGTLVLNSAPINNGTVTIKSTLQVTPSWTNGTSGTVNLQGGTLTGGVFTVRGNVNGNGTFATDVRVDSTESITSSGSGLAFRNTTTLNGQIAGGGTVFNAGTFLANGTVGPVLTNAGTVRVTAGGTLTVNNTLLNSGTIVLNTGFVVNELRNLGGGVLSNASASSLTINGGNFVNVSTSSNAFNLANTAVTLQNGAGTMTFDVAGSDFGATLAGFTNNYALSTLSITNYTAKLQTAGFSLTGSNAIYLTSLTLTADGVLDLNGLNIYFTGNTNLFGTVILNGGQIIEIAAPPAGDIVFTTSGGSQDYDISGNWDANQRATNSANNVLVAIGGGTVVTQRSDFAAFTVNSMTVSNNTTLVLGRNQTWTTGGTIGQGGTIRHTSNVTLTADVTINSGGTLSGAGTVTGLVTENAGGSLDVSNGTMRLVTQPVLNGTTIIQSSGTLDVGGNYVINNGTINLLGGSILGAELTNFGVIASSGGLISNGFVNAAGAYFNATAGTTVLTPDLVNFGTVTNSATLIISNLTAGTLGTITNGGAGLIRMSGGTLTSGDITNAATINGFGTISGTILNVAGGLVDATNGTLRLLSAPVNNNIFRVQTGGTLVVTDAVAAVLRDWSNAGTLEVRRGTVISGNLTNTGTLVGNITGANGTLSANTINLGTMRITNGTMNLTAGLTNAAAGAIDIAADGTLSVTPTWANAGSIVLRNVIANGGQLINSGTIQSSAGAGNTASINGGNVVNTGTIDVTSGLLAIVNAAGSTVTNSGFYRATGDSLRFGSTGASTGASNDFRNAGTFLFNAGTIGVGAFINSGTFRANHTGTGTITITSPSDAPFSNTVTGVIIVNSGTVLSSRTIVNLGVIDTYGNGVFGGISSTGANFTNAMGGLIINTNSSATLGIRASADRFLNQGTIVVSNNATINMQNTGGPDTGTAWRNTNTVILGNAASWGVLNTGTLNNDGTIRGTGTINLSAGAGNAPRPFVQGSTGHLIVTNGDLTITHLATGRLSINGGTLTVSGGNTLRIFSDLAATTNAALINGANVVLNGGTILSANVSNSVLSTIRGFGTLSFNNGNLSGSVSNLHNQGTILASGTAGPLVLDGSWIFNQTNGTVAGDSGLLQVNGVFTNRGTVTFLNSVGTFNGVVVNQGAWVTDPTTNVFNSAMFVDTNGYISAAGGDVDMFKSTFVNISPRSTDCNTSAAKFIFDGGTNLTLGNSFTQAFYVAGHDMLGTNFVPVGGVVTPTNAFIGGVNGDPIFGYSNNFALGTLEIGNTGTNSSLILIDSFLTGSVGTNDGLKAGLYLDMLSLIGDSILIISNNVEVYWKYTNNVYLDGANQNVFLLGDASIHQLISVPEPSVLMFLLIGGSWFAARRHRRSSAHRR